MEGLQLAFLIGLSALAVLASLHAFRTLTGYGLYRFFAFESLAALVAWNVPGWFADPLSLRQLGSWLLLASSAALALHGALLLRSVGQARARLIEETAHLVERGAYRFIRHPLYASLLLATWGVWLKAGDLPSTLLALSATAFLSTTAWQEELFNLRRFGEAYAAYQTRTGRFLPWLG